MPIKNIFFLILIAAILSSGCSQAVESADKRAPEFSLQDVNDKTVRLSDYGGKVIILNFFATRCPPCRSEIPDFVELMKEYAYKDFVIIGISVERDIEAVKKFASEYNINYPTLLDDGFVSDNYGPILNIPTTFIIDKKGNIVEKIIGSRNKDYFEGALKPLL